jgi:c(7)-type cytochrome triheme protein
MFMDKKAQSNTKFRQGEKASSEVPGDQGCAARGRSTFESQTYIHFVLPGAIVLLVVLGLCCLGSLPRVFASLPATTDMTQLSESLPPLPQDQNIDFSRFLHTNANHARLPCLLCHRRESNAAKPSMPGAGGHLPCTGCHAREFTNSSSPVCVICHTNTQSGALRSFPSLKSFNMKFDHSVHARGLQLNCAACHRPARGGQALSIPAGPNAHATCFQCHSPQAKANGRDISSCATCHQPGAYARTSTQAAAFKVGFNHTKHTAQKLSCTECHTVRATMPKRKQVTAPLALNHHAPAGVNSCATCHNGKRAFGGDDFSACIRCHRGPQWRF